MHNFAHGLNGKGGLSCNILFFSKKYLYFISKSFRNQGFAFNLGVNEIASTFPKNLSTFDQVRIKLKYSGVFNQIKDTYSLLLDAIENNDLESLQEILEQKTYLNLIYDLAKYRDKLEFLNKFDKKDKMTEVKVNPINLFYLHGVSIDRNENKGLHFLEFHKNTVTFRKTLVQSNKDLSDKPELNQKMRFQIGKEIASDPKYSHLVRVFESSENSEMLQEVKNQLERELEKEYLLEYLSKNLNDKPKENQIKSFSLLIDTNKKYKTIDHQVDSELSKDELAMINYFNAEKCYVESELKEISLVDYFRVKLPEAFHSFETTHLGRLNSINSLKLLNQENSIVVLDVLVESKRRMRIVGDDDKEDIDLSLRNDKEDGELESPEPENSENFVQKHVLRFEFANPPYFVRLFKLKINLKITDIDLSLEGNRHFN